MESTTSGSNRHIRLTFFTFNAPHPNKQQSAHDKTQQHNHRNDGIQKRDPTFTEVTTRVLRQIILLLASTELL